VIVALLDAVVVFGFAGHMTFHHAVSVVRTDETLPWKISLELLDHAFRFTLHQRPNLQP
jgi:hypothetical protein